MDKTINDELYDLYQDRFERTAVTVSIPIPTIFLILSAIQGKSILFFFAVYFFIDTFIFTNSIYVLLARKRQESIIVGGKTKIIPVYPSLRPYAWLGMIISTLMTISALSVQQSPVSIQKVIQEWSTATPTATVTPTAILAIPTSTSIPPTSTYTITPSFTPTITSTFTITPSPTPTLTATPTTNPMVFRGLDQECLIQSLWEPSYFQGESKEVDSRNCWNLTEWGITPENKGLSIVVNDSDLGQDITRRFHTKIKGDAEIKFTVRIDQFTTKPYFDGILMMGVGSSSTITKSGYYIKYAIDESENKIFRDMGPGLKLYYEPRSEYRLGESQNIIIRIVGSQAKILADGVLLRTMTLSEEERSVFWVVYSLPSNNGSLIAQISDFQIYDHR